MITANTFFIRLIFEGSVCNKSNEIQQKLSPVRIRANDAKALTHTRGRVAVQDSIL